MRAARSLLPLLVLALLLPACGREAAPEGVAPVASSGDDGTPLPTPAGASGSGVTGMPPARESPEPLTAEPVAVDPAAESAAAPEPGLVDVPGDTPAPAPTTDPAAMAPTASPAEPSIADAVAVLRGYYDAINASDFGRAYGLWSDGGQASGQSAEQFAAGFAQTRSVALDVGPPSRLEAAAGSRYLQLPVTIVATQRDGSQRRYAGTYTLRRAVVDGATAEQRAWHIVSASLRETGG